MASRIVTLLIVKLAEKITARIRKGKLWPTLLAALVGGGAGALAGLATVYLLAPGILVGAIVGASVGASLFERPPRPLGARANDTEPQSMGAIQNYWGSQREGLPTLTVLMDRAVYAAVDQQGPWREVLEKLATGDDPELSLGTLIRLEEIDCLEMAKPDATELFIQYHAAGRGKQCAAYFPDLAKRDEFLDALQQNLGKRFTEEERVLPLGRAILVPLVLLLVVGVAMGGIAALSAYWTAHPPPPPRGQAEQDALVKFLIGFGPRNVFLAGAVPLLAVFAWLCFRILRPPRVQVLALSEK